MKFVGLILLVLIVQASALPKIPLQDEATDPPQDDIKEFRSSINAHFERFNQFYDLFTDQMLTYRINHVELVSGIAKELMEIFSRDIDMIRESRSYVDEQLRAAIQRLGGTPNTCVLEVQNQIAMNSGRIGEAFGECLNRANKTISTGLAEIFYPISDDIQRSASMIPLLTLGSLARGNILEKPSEISDYLEAQFQAIDLQWKKAASQLFRWESARFDVNGNFYIEEMSECLAESLNSYRNTNTINAIQLLDTCAPST